MNKHTYDRLFALATRYKNFKRGKKFHTYKWIRLDPNNALNVQLGYWRRLHKSILDPKNPGYCNYEQLPNECFPFVVDITFTPTYATIHMPGMFEPLEPSIEPWVLEQHPTTIIRRQNVYKRVDIGLNYLLRGRLRGDDDTHIQHWGVKDPDFPGFYWVRRHLNGSWINDARKIAGPVIVEYNSNVVLPATPQPTRVVDPRRREISNSLRAAFKRLRVLQRLGVEISQEEFIQAFTGTDAKQDWAFMPQSNPEHKALIDRLRDPHRLLHQIETFDAQDRQALVELSCSIAAGYMRDWEAYSPGSSSAVANRAWYRASASPLPRDENALARLRRHLHKELDVVRYET